MAKTPALPVPTEFKLPELKLPRFDLDAWLALAQGQPGNRA